MPSPPAPTQLSPKVPLASLAPLAPLAPPAQTQPPTPRDTREFQMKRKKTVKMGEHFEEQIYPPSNETFVGEWIKYGHDVVRTENAMILLNCKSCSDDRLKRQMNKPGRYKLRSYQVEGLTNGEFLWWEFGICENKNC